MYMALGRTLLVPGFDGDSEDYLIATGKSRIVFFETSCVVQSKLVDALPDRHAIDSDMSTLGSKHVSASKEKQHIFEAS